MESSHSISSCESLYSVESATSEEEDESCNDLDIFLSDSGSEVDKEMGLAKNRRPAFPKGQRLLFSPKLERTSPGLVCRDRRRRTRRHPGMQVSGRPHPSGQRGCYPRVLASRYSSACAHWLDGDSGLPGRTRSQMKVENSSRKRLIRPAGDRGGPEYTAQPSALRIKRQRNGDAETGTDPQSPGRTDGDQLFAQKCRELQGFIQPLMELLNGLQMGRYDRGLSSFQQSVAMDRIQRIIGVLQKPEMGERYLGTLLQVETMLKVWFPRVASSKSHPEYSPAESAHRPAKQLHRPPSVEEDRVGRQADPGQDSAQSPPTEKLHQTHLSDPALADGKAGAVWKEQARFLADWSAMNLTWMHTSPICNPPLGHLNAAFGQALLGPNTNAYGVILFLHNNLAAPAAVDCATPNKASHVCCHLTQPPGLGEPLRCQSLPGAATPGSSLLSQHSKSLTHLPTSSVEPKDWKLLGEERPVYFS